MKEKKEITFALDLPLPANRAASNRLQGSEPHTNNTSSASGSGLGTHPLLWLVLLAVGLLVSVRHSAETKVSSPAVMTYDINASSKHPGGLKEAVNPLVFTNMKIPGLLQAQGHKRAPFVLRGALGAK